MNNRIYHISYSIMLIIVFFIVIWPLSHYEGQSIIDESFPEPLDFSAGWKTEDDMEVDTSKLRYLEDTKIYEEFSIYNTLPENLQEGQYLCFRSKNIFYQVYFDGKLVYEPYVPQSKFYTKSSGTRWNYVPIAMEDAGKKIEIRVMKVYESGRSSVDNLYIGQPAKAIMDTIQNKMVAFITCVLTLFVGVILIIADIPINMRNQKNHELLYLGLFAVSVATWCLAETHLLQFYLGDSRVMQLVSCCSLMLISIPMTLYLDAAFGFREKMVVSGMVVLSFLEFVVCLVLHFTRIADVHETLHFSHVVLVLTTFILLYTIIINAFSKKKHTSKQLYSVLRGIGFCGLSITALIDIFRYYKGNGNDAAMFVRIGLLIFIICFGISSLEKTVTAVKLGVQADFVSQLAYKDGLTRIGNRTAFEEQLDDLKKVKDEIPAIAIIMFDVNDLKFVNDNLGHHTGDCMLVSSAELIKESFLEEEGECFRIGGDEFAVLISGEDVKERCEAGLERFKKAMATYNEKPDKAFRISIAEGWALYDESQAGKKLTDIYQLADMRMYDNKKKIKSAQIKPEEYYKAILKGKID